MLKWPMLIFYWFYEFKFHVINSICQFKTTTIFLRTDQLTDRASYRTWTFDWLNDWLTNRVLKLLQKRLLPLKGIDVFYRKEHEYTISFVECFVITFWAGKMNFGFSTSSFSWYWIIEPSSFKILTNRPTDRNCEL